MADERVRKRRRGDGDDAARGPDSSGERRRKRRPLTGGEVAARARSELGDIIGMEIGAATSLERGDDDGWKVTVEVVELERVPRTSDLIGKYEVLLDQRGKLLEYRRVARYSRGDAEGQSRG
jgi:hypothetical protein